MMNSLGGPYTVISEQPTCITNRDPRWRFLEPPVAVYPLWAEVIDSCNFFNIENSEKVNCCQVHGEYDVMNEKKELLFKGSLEKDCCSFVKKVTLTSSGDTSSIEIDYEQTGICSFYEKDLIQINSPAGNTIGFISKQIFAILDTAYLIWDTHNRVRFRVEPIFHLAKGKEYQVLDKNVVVAHIFKKSCWKYVMSTVSDYLTAFDKANLICLIIIMDIDSS